MECYLAIKWDVVLTHAKTYEPWKNIMSIIDKSLGTNEIIGC